ncbi:MAG: tripartite tricarboxylate transporter TctB family protein [Clostridia bacterium]|nr:tripartite tricarboxylate transporter TctB family protein [Clostridia bacterium]
MTKEKKDFFSGLFFLVFGIGMYIYSYSIPNPTQAGVGAGFLPRMVGAIFVILSIALIVSTKIEMKRMTKEAAKEVKKNKIDKRSVLLSIGALFIYVILLKSVGFILMSILYLFVVINLLSPNEKRNLPLFIIISIVVPVGVYFLFVKGFDLMLPSGILG